MHGDQKMIQYFNDILTNELTAINQYFLHSRMYQNWGYKKLADKEYEESIEEMKHADEIVQRILFLEGLPNLQKIGQLNIGENVKEILHSDFALEKEAIPLFRAAIQHAESIQDYVSRELLQKLLGEEEDHYDWLETQLQILEQLGEANYLQSQLG